MTLLYVKSAGRGLKFKSRTRMGTVCFTHFGFELFWVNSRDLFVFLVTFCKPMRTYQLNSLPAYELISLPAHQLF